MKRTLKQNNSMHQWETATASECVDKGFDVKVFFTKPDEIPMSKSLVHYMIKRYLWRNTGKESTADATTAELSEAIENARNLFAKNTEGEVNLPFPVKSENYEETN